MHVQILVRCIKLKYFGAPQTVQYGRKDMAIKNEVAANRSGAMCVTFYSRFIDKVQERKSYMPISLKIHSCQSERYFKTTSKSTIVILKEAAQEV